MARWVGLCIFYYIWRHPHGYCKESHNHWPVLLLHKGDESTKHLQFSYLMCCTKTSGAHTMSEAHPRTSLAATQFHVPPLTRAEVELLLSKGDIVLDPLCWNAYGRSETLTIPPVSCLLKGLPQSITANRGWLTFFFFGWLTILRQCYV